MKRRNNKRISLLDFIRTGKFDIVELGNTKEWILNSFCKPDDKSYMGHDMSIWRYSTFELHFHGNILHLLWCDTLFGLRNPSKKQFKFDKWILKDLDRLTFSYFCLVLTELNIQFSVAGK